MRVKGEIRWSDDWEIKCYLEFVFENDGSELRASTQRINARNYEEYILYDTVLEAASAARAIFPGIELVEIGCDEEGFEFEVKVPQP